MIPLHYLLFLPCFIYQTYPTLLYLLEHWCFEGSFVLRWQLIRSGVDRASSRDLKRAKECWAVGWFCRWQVSGQFEVFGA